MEAAEERARALRRRAVASDTDLSEIRKKWFEEKGLDPAKAARQHSDRPIRNHGLFSKAERALEIAGWSERARRRRRDLPPGRRGGPDAAADGAQRARHGQGQRCWGSWLRLTWPADRRGCRLLPALPVLVFLARGCGRGRPQPTPVHRRFCCSDVRTYGRAHGRSNSRRRPHDRGRAWHDHNSRRFRRKCKEKYQGRKSLHALNLLLRHSFPRRLKACRYAPWEPQFIDLCTSVTSGAHGVG